MKWKLVDTRQMDHLRTIVDGYIHVVPEPTMHKHWVQSDCWCDPVVHWDHVRGVPIVRHNYRGRNSAKIHTEGWE
jgi:hypothetical protein